MAKKKTIITAALQGAGGSKAANPATPITPEELAEDAYNCWKAGAAVISLHQKKMMEFHHQWKLKNLEEHKS